MKMNLRLLITSILFLLLTTNYSNAMTSNQTQEPLQIPIHIPFNITKAGNKVEVWFKIDKNDKYVFGLNFYEDDKTREAPLKKRDKFLTSSFVQYISLFTSTGYHMVKDAIFPPEPVVKKPYEPSKLVVILGSREDKKDGVQVPIKLKLYEVDQLGKEELILNEESRAADSSTVRQRIIDVIELSSGVYRVEVEAINDNPSLDGFLSDLVIGRNYIIGNDAAFEKQRKINFKK